jgi:hypothetical protein
LPEQAHAGDVTRADEPILVTTAAQSPRQEQRDRQRRYLVTMGIRVVCIILAIVFFGVGFRWAAGLAVAASLILPWVAVIAANSGPHRTAGSPLLYPAERPKAIEPPPR